MKQEQSKNYTEEIFKPIDGYEIDYAVSNMGRVKSFKRDLQNGRILKPQINKIGYEVVQLCYGGDSKNHYVHVLVYAAFGEGTIDKDSIIYFKDTNRSNAAIENLVLLSRFEHRSRVKFQREEVKRRMYSKNKWL